MDPGVNQYCSIYVQAPDSESVLAMLGRLLGGEADGEDLILDGYSLSVLRNPDVAETPGDDFVRWPVLVEVEADDPNDQRRIVEPTARIVTTLWKAGLSAVAACDFEDELPWGGGILRIRRSSTGDSGS